MKRAVDDDVAQPSVAHAGQRQLAVCIAVGRHPGSSGRAHRLTVCVSARRIRAAAAARSRSRHAVARELREHRARARPRSAAAVGSALPAPGAPASACTTVPTWRWVSPTQLNSGGSRAQLRRGQVSHGTAGSAVPAAASPRAGARDSRPRVAAPPRAAAAVGSSKRSASAGHRRQAGCGGPGFTAPSADPRAGAAGEPQRLARARGGDVHEARALVRVALAAELLEEARRARLLRRADRRGRAR